MQCRMHSKGKETEGCTTIVLHRRVRLSRLSLSRHPSLPLHRTNDEPRESVAVFSPSLIRPPCCAVQVTPPPARAGRSLFDEPAAEDPAVYTPTKETRTLIKMDAQVRGDSCGPSTWHVHAVATLNLGLRFPAAERRHPHMPREDGLARLQTVEEPVLFLPWVCFRGGIQTVASPSPFSPGGAQAAYQLPGAAAARGHLHQVQPVGHWGVL